MFERQQSKTDCKNKQSCNEHKALKILDLSTVVPHDGGGWFTVFMPI